MPSWCWRRRPPTAHPAFSKLFVQTEYFAEADRAGDARRRSPGGAGSLGCSSGYRRRRDGRRDGGRNRPRQVPWPRHGIRGRPRCIDGRSLSARSASFSIPSLPCAAVCGSQPARSFVLRSGPWPLPPAALLDLVDKHHDATAFDRAASLAWTQAQVQLRHLDVDADEAALFQRLAGHLLYAGPTMRASSDEMQRRRRTTRAMGPEHLR